ncbi:hypothetical protein [Streptomyces sp. NRRL B-24484]|uniref:hypothetical protein n=1 Tax=Streptomyces sp. NRRL B-24484 TaxID=1463833 RepID=UPI001331551A|nr:hypothetical protein [Streptomyces sp. NRRL B-24484]
MVLEAGPWLLRPAAEPYGWALQMEFTAGAAASAFVLGAALGRVREWMPCAAAGLFGALALPAAAVAYDDPSGFAVFTAVMLDPLFLLALVMGACVGTLVGPSHDD